MNKHKKRTYTLNKRITKILLFTLLPVIFLVILLSVFIWRAMYKQIYAANENEMQIFIRQLDSDISVLDQNIIGMVEDYQTEMFQLREDTGVLSYNMWEALRNVRLNNPVMDVGFVEAQGQVCLTCESDRFTKDDIQSIKSLVLEQVTEDKENFHYYLISDENHRFFMICVKLEELTFGGLIDANRLLEQLKYSGEESGVKNDFVEAQPENPGEHTLFTQSEQTGYYLVRDFSGHGIYTGAVGGIILILIALASLILLPILWVSIRRFVILPLERVRGAMAQVEGDNMDYRLTVPEETEEFSSISQGFNQMTEQIKNLKIEAYERDIEKLRLENINLRLQVNPHLLLNCLNMIYSLSKSRNYQGIEEMSIHLSRYFQYALYNSSEFSTIKEEIDFVTCYMEIQKIRFPGAFTFVYDVDEELFDRQVPSMLIQNFVENSVKYALNMENEIDIIVIVKEESS